MEDAQYQPPQPISSSSSSHDRPRERERSGRDSRDSRDARDSRDSRDSREHSSRSDRDRDRDRERDRGDRDRERDSRRHSPRRRSRSRSRERHERRRSPSPSAPPVFRKRNPISGWDVMPSAESVAQAAAIAQAYSQQSPFEETRKQLAEQHAHRKQPLFGQDPNLLAAAANSIPKQARKIYAGNLPNIISEDEIGHFFTQVMLTACSNLQPGNPVVSVHLNLEKKFAFVEFRTPEEATAAIDLDGVAFKGSLLKVRRPSDYTPATNVLPPNLAPRIDLSKLGVISTQVADGPNKVFCGGLPYDLNEEQIKELVSSFGKLKSFHLVRDKDSILSKGYCFFEYEDVNVTDVACQTLNDMTIGDRKLTVRRAQTKGNVPPMGLPTGMPFPPMGVPNAAASYGAVPALIPLSAPSNFDISTNPFENPHMLQTPSRILCLLSMVDPSELHDDQEYQDIMDDISDECSRFGRVLRVYIPRPSPMGAPPGVGKVWVEFGSIDQCSVAKKNLEGRKFADRSVIASFYPESHYSNGVFF